MIGTVLIIDSVATNRIVLKVKLGAAGYRTLTAADAASGLALAHRERPDIILLDVDLLGADGSDDGGIAVLTALRAAPDTARMLIVMLSTSGEMTQRLRALRAGADEFMSKPLNDQTLFARLRNLARAQEDMGGAAIAAFGMAEPAAGFAPPGHIAIVTLRPEVALRWRSALQPFSRDHFSCLSQDQVYRQSGSSDREPDVFLIEAGLSDSDGGLKVMLALRSRQETRHAKVCILNTETAPTQPAMAFDMGADDLVSAHQQNEEVALRLGALVRRKREADRIRASVKDGLRLAMIDPLTGIPNRRSGLAHLRQIAETSIAERQAFALMVLDIDRFKTVNDRFGHAAGDAVLIEVARRLTTCLRATDLIARIGGEEFLICLPNTTLAESRSVAERLCHEIEKVPVRLRPGEELRVTVSIGLSLSHETDGSNAPDLITGLFDRADHALLHAKEAGRNQVTISRSAA